MAKGAEPTAIKEISFDEADSGVNWDDLEPIRIKRQSPPNYACVEIEAITRGQRSTKDGTKHIGRFLETLYIPMSSYDDITTIEGYRRRKGWAVVGHHNILTDPKFQDRKIRQPKDEAYKLVRELDALISPPELKRAVKNG